MSHINKLHPLLLHFIVHRLTWGKCRYFSAKPDGHQGSSLLSCPFPCSVPDRTDRVPVRIPVFPILCHFFVSSSFSTRVFLSPWWSTGRTIWYHFPRICPRGIPRNLSFDFLTLSPFQDKIHNVVVDHVNDNHYQWIFFYHVNFSFPFL